ncbi:uncharacterized protein LOC135825066 [Sycon ciliatum]|uniref:uncharacterized protein LOC135825066 n=1 Tax=Sycon ciliatum TaxID=27933 RepID=UPI0031F66498|eukprot:scpid51715/ scgid13492/ 
MAYSSVMLPVAVLLVSVFGMSHALDADKAICQATGHAYSQVTLTRTFVCEAKDAYRKLPSVSIATQIYMPRGSVTPAELQTQPLLAQYSAILSVLKTTQDRNYYGVANTYKAILNAAPNVADNGPFTKIGGEMADIQKSLNNMMTLVPGFSFQYTQSLQRRRYPRPMSSYKNLARYHYDLQCWNLGMLEATCLTLGDIRITLQNALNTYCT